MIKVSKGNIIDAESEALVNTVNCIGFMGKGIALQFKKAFPENFEAYSHACRAKEVNPGRMFVYETGNMLNPRYIINFPTKWHWRENSRLEDIESGLQSLVQEIRQRGIKSVAVPPLGCGLGGLDWQVVRPMIEKAMSQVPDVDVKLFEPAGTPKAKEMPVHTKRPRMTVARSLFIKLMKQYSELAYRLTLLEIQKLAYFLQEAGEPLRLRYEAGLYGPYAHNLNKVLEALEGHFIRGYGDTQRPDVEIELLPGAVQEAESFLVNHPDTQPRLERVGNLIEGFETPYGMELLSSVHWVAHADEPAMNSDEAINKIHHWADRKKKLFKPDHIRIAWERLQKQGWLNVEGN